MLWCASSMKPWIAARGVCPTCSLSAAGTGGDHDANDDKQAHFHHVVEAIQVPDEPGRQHEEIEPRRAHGRCGQTGPRPQASATLAIASSGMMPG
jgi:hypothetical protein